MAGVQGLVSGIDTGAIISQVMATARRPLQNLQSQFRDLSAQRSAMQELNTLLTGLETAIQAVDTTSELGAYATSSSNQAALSATVSGAPSLGSYDIGVVSVAKASVERSQGFATATDTIADGTFDIDVGGTVTSITVDAATGTNTPDGLVSYINQNVSGAQAFVLNTGNGANPFEIVVQGTATGEANDVVSTYTYGGSGSGAQPVFTTVQGAEDAEITLAGTSVFVGSNTPVDVIPGVTLNITSPTTSDVTINVSQDVDGTANNVKSVVDAYNKLRSFVKAQAGTTAGTGGPLAGDSTLRAVANRLQSVVNSTAGQGTLSGLGELGLDSSQSGQLQFNASEFKTTLGAATSDTMNMLVGTNGVFTNLMAEIDIVADPVNGLIQPRLDSFDTRMDDVADAVARQESRLATYEESLRGQFVSMELTLAKYQATGDYVTQQLQAMTAAFSSNNRR